jgi:hypothetical protein
MASMSAQPKRLATRENRPITRADQEFAVPHGKSHRGRCVGQNPPENWNHERVPSFANESTDIVAKARLHESRSEDLVLAEDDKEEPDGDAQQGQRNRIGIALLLRYSRVVIDRVHGISFATTLCSALDCEGSSMQVIFVRISTTFEHAVQQSYKRATLHH